MSNEWSGTYDLEERTAKFGEAILEFARMDPKNEIMRPLLTQLVRAGTNVGANYCEADDAESSKDFKHKIGIAKKEARILWQVAKELHLIFNTIYTKVEKSLYQIIDFLQSSLAII